MVRAQVPMQAQVPSMPQIPMPPELKQQINTLYNLTNQIGPDRNGAVPATALLAKINAEAAQSTVLGLASIRQALFDILGAYPAANVLPYGYSFSNTTAKGNAVGAGATINNSIKITADSAFIARYVTGASTGAYLIFPRMDASDRQLVNEAVHSAAWVGTAERPNILPKPLLLPANTTISFDVTDLSGAENEVYFTFIGFKIYGYTPET